LKVKNFEYTDGFALIGFPANMNQAKLFEKELSGFVQKSESKKFNIFFKLKYFCKKFNCFL